jgi:hypothetical protein
VLIGLVSAVPSCVREGRDASFVRAIGSGERAFLEAVRRHEGRLGPCAAPLATAHFASPGAAAFASLDAWESARIALRGSGCGLTLGLGWGEMFDTPSGRVGPESLRAHRLCGDGGLEVRATPAFWDAMRARGLPVGLGGHRGPAALEARLGGAYHVMVDGRA